MNFFAKAFIDFFKQLSVNNNKDWFNANKTEYETNVKIPFENFVSQLIIAISKQEILVIFGQNNVSVE